MTQPGFVAPTTPGWWVRTNRIGTNKTGYNWDITAIGHRDSLGTAEGDYGWAAGSAVGIGRFVTFDAVGAGGHGGTSITFTHTATAGAYVILTVAGDRSDTPTATYGGVAMTVLASIGNNNNDAFPNGRTVQFGFASAPGGSKTVDVESPGGAWLIANTVSYTTIGSIGATTTVFGSGTTLSQGPIVCPDGGIIVQSFGQGAGSAGFTSLTGGTVRYNQFNLDGNGAGITIMESAATATFTAHMGSAAWAGIATVLNYY
jgi:hypothetical protein